MSKSKEQLSKLEQYQALASMVDEVIDEIEDAHSIFSTELRTIIDEAIFKAYDKGVNDWYLDQDKEMADEDFPL